LQRTKLDALLALAEAHDCRRVRLLAYFGQASVAGYRCQNCDNCVNAPSTWDATDAARKALSCIYRFRQAGEAGRGPRSFGAGHLIDVLRGKVTDKVTQFGHKALSTFGVGADVSEVQWRSVLRQLIALGHVRTEGEYNTLTLNDSARDLLRGSVPVYLRLPAEAPRRGKVLRPARTGRGVDKPPPVALQADATQRFAALKAWRAEVAAEHNLPAYVVFHDATLAEMARAQPGDLGALAQISGVGAKKLEAYGRALLSLLHPDREQCHAETGD